MCTIVDHDDNSFEVTVQWKDLSKPEAGGTIQYRNPQRPTRDGHGCVTLRSGDRAFKVKLDVEYSSEGNFADGPDIRPSMDFMVTEEL